MFHQEYILVVLRELRLFSIFVPGSHHGYYNEKTRKIVILSEENYERM